MADDQGKAQGGAKSGSMIKYVAAILVVVIIALAAVFFLGAPKGGGQAGTPAGTGGGSTIQQAAPGAPVLSIPNLTLAYNTTESIHASAANKNDSVVLYVNGSSVSGPGKSLRYAFSGMALGKFNITAKDRTTNITATEFIDVVPGKPVLSISSMAIKYGTNESIYAVGDPSTEYVEILVDGQTVTQARNGTLDFMFNQNQTMAVGKYNITVEDVNASLQSSQTVAIEELPNVTYTKITNLTSDVEGYNIMVAPGAVVYANGYSILAQNNFTDQGTIITGNSTGYNYPQSYGGSGGGGGVGGNNYGSYSGHNGGNTTVSGGTGGLFSNNVTSPGNSGSSAKGTMPSQQLSNLIATWHSRGMQNYLAGGGGANGGNGAGGGQGAYGLYIQAQNITISGIIYANGQNGQVGGANGQYCFSGNGGGGGGGGGGTILLAYADGLSTAGSILNVSGGNGGSSQNAKGLCGGADYTSNGGGGGTGQVVSYKYGFMPVTP